MKKSDKFMIAVAIVQSRAYRAAMRKARKAHPKVRVGIRSAWAYREAEKEVVAVLGV